MKNPRACALLLSLTAGCVSGLVLDQNGNPVAGATVTIYDCLQPGCYSAQVVTDSTGRYTYDPYIDSDAIPDLPYFYSNDTFDHGMAIVVEARKWQTQPTTCVVQEGAAIAHNPGVYQRDSGSGQYYTMAPDIRLAQHTYTGTTCANAPDYAPDQDLDGIADSLEPFYGTASNDTDTDDDGINDGLEVRGVGRVWVFGTSPPTLEYDVQFDMAHEGATPTKRDLFVWWNWQNAETDIGYPVNMYPPQELRDYAMTFFDSPGYAQSGELMNADGTNGLRVHITPGEPFTNFNNPGNGTHIESVGCGVHGASVPDRREWTHLLSHAGFRRYQDNNGTPSIVWQEGFNCSEGGSGTIDGQYLGRACSAGIQPDQVICDWPRYTPDPMNDNRLHEWFYTFMHELGHNLGLRHGGTETQNCKPNYWSLMSYTELFRSPSTGGYYLSNSRLQFSDGENASINESAIVETDPFALGPSGFYSYDRFMTPFAENYNAALNIGGPGIYQSPAWGWVDFDDDTAHDLTTYQKVLRSCEDGGGYRTLHDANDYDLIKTGLSAVVPISAPVNYLPGEPRIASGIQEPGYPGGYVPGEGEYPFDSDTAAGLEELTGKQGDELLAFLRKAGLDVKSDGKLLRRFAAVRKETNAKELVLSQLYPDGIPAYISNKALEAEVRAVVRAGIEDAVGYGVDVEFVDCTREADTLAKLGTLIQAVRLSGQRTYGTAEFFGATTVEDAVPAIAETGLITLCR